MPIYKYNCQNADCNHTFDYFHVRSDDHATCPKCGTSVVARSEEPPKDTGFVLRGGGWAKDGYKKKGR